MNVRQLPPIDPGWSVFGSDARLVGRVDAVFADYLLVRTAALVPVDLYVPLDAVVAFGGGRVALGQPSGGAYERWHRPLKRVAHD